MVVGLVALFTVLLTWPGAVESALTSLSTVSGLGRLQLFQGALTLIQDYPLIGAGLDLFRMLHASYVMLLHVGFAVHSHNLYLDVAIEQGLPGLFALLWLWAIFGLVLWQAAKLQKRTFKDADAELAIEPTADAPLSDAPPTGARPATTKGKATPAAGQRQDRHRRRSGRQAGVLAAAAVSLMTVALHGLVDDAFYGSRAVMLLFIPLAFSATRLAQWRALSRAEGGAFESGKLTSLRRANLIAVGALAAALVLVALVPALRSYWWSNLAAISQSQTELGVYSWPEWPVQDELRRQLDVGPAAAAYERALSLNPNNIGANRRLAMIELSLGAYEKALHHLEQAYAGAAWDNAVRQLLGEALVVNGRVADGTALWQTVDNDQGQLELRRFWYRHIGDAQRLDWVEEALRAILRR
jgi:hypothetical protein